ncbi:hypothetical protein K449DRAFT_429816 [Hypoxylon sp. EC38]|nr:hypothetical protein K449DRAFT_429816 [Hypoxylon sp. EC38]
MPKGGEAGFCTEAVQAATQARAACAGCRNLGTPSLWSDYELVSRPSSCESANLRPPSSNYQLVPGHSAPAMPPYQAPSATPAPVTQDLNVPARHHNKCNG